MKIPYLMHPEHPRWDEFMDRLWTACDFEVTDFTELKWRADCRPGQHVHCAKVLKKMGADVQASIAHFQTMGGGCDCEVIVNIDMFGKQARDAAAKN